MKKGIKKIKIKNEDNVENINHSKDDAKRKIQLKTKIMSKILFHVRNRSLIKLKTMLDEEN